MAEFFRWFRSGGAGASLLELGCISGDGPFHRMLIDLSNELGLRSCITDIFTRGLWPAGYDKNTDAESAASGDLRRRLRRKEERPCERARAEHLATKPGAYIVRWL